MALLDQFLQQRGQLVNQAGQESQIAGQESEQARFRETSNLRSIGIGALEALNFADEASQNNFLTARAQEIQGRGGDATDTLEALEIPFEQRQNVLQGAVQIAQQAGALNELASQKPVSSQKGTSFITKDESGKLFVNTPVFNPRTAQSDINKVAVTDSLVSKLGETGDEETLRKIEEARKKELGKSKAKAGVKAGEEVAVQIDKVDQNISNIGRAISALDKGARTGAVQSLLPSVSAASVELDNIRNQLGLDIVSAGKFGALSESELKFALDTAIPSKLNEKELKEFLVRKSDAQTKLRAGLVEAAKQFSEGKTRAELVTEKPASGTFTSSSGIQFTVE